MKRKIAILMGLALSLTAFSPAWSEPAEAPNPAGPPWGLGQGRRAGPGRNLTPEQRAERQKAMQAYVAGLREKKANSTITPQELAWLERMEQRGGCCINGVPRGPRGGFGARAMENQGQGGGRMGRGWCGGAGPGANPNCPFNQPPAQ